ncbi:unnamed protein product [Angiostrongylus costaricensis]|uniref:G_PROTEIN_RECEP_F1_2 domain-containing protein n=1 Tax=Angiostrongylus costaricensis TaxID=334426 RepID=A0A0R3PLZ6_ANGCS|nr:unnamed protein product [Angiostrongylus costaricensis]
MMKLPDVRAADLVMEKTDRLLLGASLTIISLSFLIIYIPVLVVFFANKEFRRAWGYVIMMHIGVTDVMQLMIHAYSGVLVATDINLDMHTEKVW